MKRLVSLLQLTSFALLAFLNSSCTKEISPIGLDLLNPIDMLSMGYTDTISIRAYTIPDDSVYTRRLSYAQVGSMYDPIFGRTNATFYSQVLTSTTSARFGTNPVFDSAFLYLPYKGASYGDTLSNMTLRVYELTESIIDSVHAYSNQSVSYDAANPIGEITFRPAPHDSVTYEGSKHIPTLRIRINEKFGNFVLAADTTSLNTSAAFAKYFKGISIVAEPQNSPGKGCIINLDLTTLNSYIKMYYHNTEDTTSYFFDVNSTCPRFQNYDHNGYAEAIPMLKQQMEGNTSLGQQFLFAQGLGGVKIKIEFPYLKQSLDPQKTILNDAQLILGNASVSDVFKSPTYLTLRNVGENGTTSPFNMVDEDQGAGYFDGTYDAGSNLYRFRLTRYVQQLLLGQGNTNGLHLIIPSSGYNGARLVLNGTSSKLSDMKLYLRYTVRQ